MVSGRSKNMYLMPGQLLFIKISWGPCEHTYMYPSSYEHQYTAWYTPFSDTGDIGVRM